jgi:crotonobetainyl-CoA:carnitine CoA-transferase CaiB-like acyl-CoA transferase
VHPRRIALGDAEPFTPRPEVPLGGVHALGFSHVIAGPGMGGGLAYHGADVLNLWTPDDFEMDFNYYSANVGIRSAVMDCRRPEEMARFRRLVAGADIVFANRRLGLLEKRGITSSELVRLRPGIVQVDFSIYGAVGPVLLSHARGRRADSR